ncbi:MAG TPA: oligogalacturonate lyase family protein [Bryobacteraceae bacterium]|nr:oligogalacturonate lyase family protein [Bryobacteraceae bacterium]
MTPSKSFTRLSLSHCLSAFILTAALPAIARADDAGLAPVSGTEPPKSWVDPDTGHRVFRITNEPGSDSFYFNFNAFTPDGKEMVYATSDGNLMVLRLADFVARPLASGITRAIVVGHKTPTIYFTKKNEDSFHLSLWAANIDTGEIRKLADLPRRASVVTINADETLGAGSYIEGDIVGPGVYGGKMVEQNKMGQKNLGEPENKEQNMAMRLAAKLPNTLFTVNLQTGAITKLIEHSTDWLNHFQFSPVDPTLLMYCHEGSWQQVDRIWTIRTDGTQNQLIHKRIMKMEIAGHEWWGADGDTIWYQLQFPRRVPDSSFISSYNVRTGARAWYHQNPDAGSIHHNTSPDGKDFCGDGNPRNPWIVLCHQVPNPDDHTLGTDLIDGGSLKVERLVNMSKTAIHGQHNYRLEPNPMFTPDQKYVVFRSNFFGPDYAFAVEVAKATTP